MLPANSTLFGLPFFGVVERISATTTQFPGRSPSNVDGGYIRVSLPYLPCLDTPPLPEADDRRFHVADV